MPILQQYLMFKKGLKNFEMVIAADARHPMIVVLEYSTTR